MANDKGNEISETVLTVEQLETLECGGASRLQIDNVTTLCKYVVSNVTGKQTEWGKRIDFTLRDDYGEYILSDWNIQTKKKFKPLDLVGKIVTIEPSKNPKKVVLNVLE